MQTLACACEKAPVVTWDFLIDMLVSRHVSRVAPRRPVSLIWHDACGSQQQPAVLRAGGYYPVFEFLSLLHVWLLSLLKVFVSWCGHAIVNDVLLRLVCSFLASASQRSSPWSAQASQTLLERYVMSLAAVGVWREWMLCVTATGLPPHLRRAVRAEPNDRSQTLSLHPGSLFKTHSAKRRTHVSKLGEVVSTLTVSLLSTEFLSG